MNQKILILESSWAENENYMEDTRSTAKIYTSAETLLSIRCIPTQVIQEGE